MTAHSATWTPRMDSATGRKAGFFSDLNRGVKFFHPEMPTASRTSRRAQGARSQR